MLVEDVGPCLQQQTAVVLVAVQIQPPVDHFSQCVDYLLLLQLLLDAGDTEIVEETRHRRQKACIFNLGLLRYVKQRTEDNICVPEHSSLVCVLDQDV